VEYKQASAILLMMPVRSVQWNMYIEIMLAGYICERLLVSLGINAIYINTEVRDLR
jgi:hypothetical protein